MNVHSAHSNEISGDFQFGICITFENVHLYTSELFTQTKVLKIQFKNYL